MNYENFGTGYFYFTYIVWDLFFGAQKSVSAYYAKSLELMWM